MDIEGFGPSKIEYLFNMGLIKNYLDIYRIREKELNRIDVYFDDDLDNNNNISLRDRSGWGNRSVNNLLKSIDDSRKIQFHR